MLIISEMLYHSQELLNLVIIKIKFREEKVEYEKTNETSNIETMKRILANYDDEDEITSKILVYKKV